MEGGSQNTAFKDFSVIDWQKKCSEIQGQINKEKEENHILRQELDKRKERFDKRETEFRKIIEELQDELR